MTHPEPVAVTDARNLVRDHRVEVYRFHFDTGSTPAAAARMADRSTAKLAQCMADFLTEHGKPCRADDLWAESSPTAADRRCVRVFALEPEQMQS